MDARDETEDLLERAKAGADAPVAVSPRGDAPGEKPTPAWVRVVALATVFAVGAGAVGWLLSGEDTFVYSETIEEVVAEPSEHLGRTLRVEGALTNGSVQFREEPCEWRFVLESGERRMPVEFPQCVVPDTFRDGMGISVTVEGRLREDGSFLASQVIPKCPSRYEMDQRQQAGEAMPHAAPPETSAVGMPRPPS
ncbi:cytochrome c maturation protein CcmE [Sandaracinus amylolyticus]|uniref:Cytochrome c-type biogenesis protein CcmE, heme chaperone n=1 Tax=Sandaracinus amylolyticus TaxID=927083 RepID=A0A0F6SFP7_9BACT|nr:cytochrome c maturation protein CcmE [Sandaracinus amylolyticus]AKF07314.1 hypothetical protein DB32_004463 [Sandaracinus amylolyticus]